MTFDRFSAKKALSGTGRVTGFVRLLAVAAAGVGIALTTWVASCTPLTDVPQLVCKDDTGVAQSCCYDEFDNPYACCLDEAGNPCGTDEDSGSTDAPADSPTDGPAGDAGSDAGAHGDAGTGEASDAKAG
jgi:hypothetical protein